MAVGRARGCWGEKEEGTEGVENRTLGFYLANQPLQILTTRSTRSKNLGPVGIDGTSRRPSGEGMNRGSALLITSAVKLVTSTCYVIFKFRSFRAFSDILSDITSGTTFKGDRLETGNK